MIPRGPGPPAAPRGPPQTPSRNTVDTPLRRLTARAAGEARAAQKLEPSAGSRKKSRHEPDKGVVSVTGGAPGGGVARRGWPGSSAEEEATSCPSLGGRHAGRRAPARPTSSDSCCLSVRPPLVTTFTSGRRLLSPLWRFWWRRLSREAFLPELT